MDRNNHVVVALRDIVEAMDVPNDGWTAFLNVRTGALVTQTDGDEIIGDEDDDVDLESEDYVQLPDRFDIDEYRMMQRFCMQVADERVRERLLRAIEGSGAFGRFKGLVRQVDQLDAWHAYREAAYEEIAVQWLRDNEIAFERGPARGGGSDCAGASLPPP